MKKILKNILLVLICFMIIGCKKQNVNDWIINKNDSSLDLKADYIKPYNDAMKDKDYNYELVGLLGEQVVSGTNYMYLVYDSDNNNYKVITVYKNLENKSSILYTNDFDVTKYVNESKEANTQNISGGWITNIFGKNKLNKKEIDLFNKSTEKIVSVSYIPISVLATEEKSGTNYAYLCYGKTQDKIGTTNIYLLTVYEDEHHTKEVVSICYIDLSKFAK